jgi:hypothetical protein
MRLAARLTYENRGDRYPGSSLKQPGMQEITLLTSRTWDG